MKDDASITVALIAEGHAVRLTPQGVSMRPLLDGKTDSVVVGPLQGDPKPGDLVLFREAGGLLAVHRVLCVRGESGACDLLGDGNITPERDVPLRNVFGRVERICRRGREFSVRHPFYRIYVLIWMHTRRYRKKLLRLLAK
ncbi:MAG: S24/S26 family peptidase [Clostridia bacterium]|nr:S24/S26 family peptidase [Clostridia bacterium]